MHSTEHVVMGSVSTAHKRHYATGLHCMGNNIRTAAAQMLIWLWNKHNYIFSCFSIILSSQRYKPNKNNEPLSQNKHVVHTGAVICNGIIMPLYFLSK